MKNILLLLLLLVVGCNTKGERITKTGFLIIDGSRNHTSFDYFVPCPINDTLTILENLKRATPGQAINMRQHKLDFDLMRGSWAVTNTQLFPSDSSSGKYWYVSAVEITYREEDNDPSVIIRNDSTTLGGILLSTSIQTSPRNETISVKQFVFPHP